MSHSAESSVHLARDASLSDFSNVSVPDPPTDIVGSVANIQITGVASQHSGGEDYNNLTTNQVIQQISLPAASALEHDDSDLLHAVRNLPMQVGPTRSYLNLLPLT